MASDAANAQRYDSAQTRIKAAMERISRNAGLSAPAFGPQARDPATRYAVDADRAATFLEQVANTYDPRGAVTAQTQTALGGTGEYNALEEEAKAKVATEGKGGKAAPATATTPEPPDPDSDDPVAEMNVPEAVDRIGRMRSREKLEAVVANDQRETVKAAAQKRLGELNG